MVITGLFSSKVLLLSGAAALVLAAALGAGILSRAPFSEAALYYFDEHFLTRAAEYQRLSLQTALARNLLTWGYLAAVALLSWKYFSRAAPFSLPQVAVAIALILLGLYLITLPLDYYRGFILEHRFGLTQQSPGSWLLYYLKSNVLALALTVLTLTGLYALMQYFPLRWPFIGGALAALLLLAGTYLYPLLIDPLFYSFQPLQEEKMNSQIISMAEEAGIQVEEVLVADASRRTLKANAYFTGLGDSRRIVVFDNLLERFSQEEALAVIAHEIAHWKYSHILKGIFLGAVQTFVTLLLLSLALKELGIMKFGGIYGDLRAIMLALLLFSLLSFVSLPLQNVISRAFERQADLKAIELTGDRELQVELHRNLAETNLSQVDPHPLVRAVLYTHPSTLERIELATTQKR